MRESRINSEPSRKRESKVTENKYFMCRWGLWLYLCLFSFSEWDEQLHVRVAAVLVLTATSARTIAVLVFFSICMETGCHHDAGFIHEAY